MEYQSSKYDTDGDALTKLRKINTQHGTMESRIIRFIVVGVSKNNDKVELLTSEASSFFFEQLQLKAAIANVLFLPIEKRWNSDKGINASKKRTPYLDVAIFHST